MDNNLEVKKIKIARVVTVPEAFVHIKPLLKLLLQKNIEVVLISSKGPYEAVLQKEIGLSVKNIEISREINLVSDIKALFELICFFRNSKFDIIHSSTPKAGLLVALAGLFTFKSVRLHTFTGQRWTHMGGPLRILLKLFDKLILILNTKCYTDSISQIEYLKHEGIASSNLTCLNKGSYGGVDCERFDRSHFPNAKKELAEKLKLHGESIFILFVGRLTKDKGVDDLVAAFKRAQKEDSRIKLVLIGEHRVEIDVLSTETLREIENNPNIFNLGYQQSPEKYFSAADIFCLPSYREGFGTVVLEAAACGVCTIGTKIPGLVDAIVEGETGLLVGRGNIDELSQAILKLSVDSELRNKFAENAKKRARIDFNSKLISEMQLQEYLSLLKNI